ncbi:MAG: hypothetical protein EP298_03520 [Gammaproteobacteria bacterium]|nr:MAG: hypothetical protein EP298_03520 [Gammaproteobacteria bacterium]
MTFNSASKYKISVLTALAVAIVFCGSVLYNFAFFYSIKININKIPITIEDIVSSFTLWLYGAFIILVIMYVIAKIIACYDKDISEDEIRKSSSKLTNFLRVLPYILIIVFLVILPIISFVYIGVPLKSHYGMTPNKYLSLYCLSFVIINLIVIAKLNQIGKERISDVLFLPSSMFIIFITFAFYSGYSSGMISDDNDYPIAYVTNKAIEVVVIRPLEIGVLGLNSDNNDIIFIPWNNIDSINP